MQQIGSYARISYRARKLREEDRRDPEALHRRLVSAWQDVDEANHRIANSLQQAAIMVRAQRHGMQTEEAGTALRETATRLEGIARLHRRICYRDEGDLVAVNKFFDELRTEIETAFGLKIAVECNSELVPGYVTTQISIIVNELILNSIKHVDTEIDVKPPVVRCCVIPGTLKLTYSDHGPGFPEVFDFEASRKGFGLSIVAYAVERMGGVISTNTDDGELFAIEVPLS